MCEPVDLLAIAAERMARARWERDFPGETALAFPESVHLSVAMLIQARRDIETLTGIACAVSDELPQCR